MVMFKGHQRVVTCKCCTKNLKGRQRLYCSDACKQSAHRRRQDPLVGSPERKRSQTRPLFEQRQVQQVTHDLRSSNSLGGALVNFEPGVRTDDPKDPLLPGPGRRIRTSEFIRVANIIRSLYGEKFPTITETILGKDLATHRRLIYQETPTRLSARRQPANRKLTELYPEERKLLLKLKVFTELDFLNADQLAVNTLTKREPSKRVAYTRFACPHCKDALAVENPLFGCGHIYTADDPMLCGGDKDLPPSIKRHVEKSCASPTTGDQEDVAEVLTQLVALKAHVDSRFDSLEAGQRESFVKLARMIRSRFPDHPTVVESVDEFIDMVLGDGG